MARDTKAKLAQKISSGQDLENQLAEWRAQQKKIVFTNGCFDLIHPGHIAYLNEAASLGDILVVGLNTDRSVSVLKGPHRPINDEFSRSQLIASMFFVDAVVFFDEQTPINLINTVKPDVLVKGGDYQIETIVGSQETLARGGEVKVLGFLEGYSSTAIINKIKHS